MNNISFCGNRRAGGRSAIKFDLPERDILYFTFRKRAAAAAVFRANGILFLRVKETDDETEPFSVAVFDMDGTLLNSMHIWDQLIDAYLLEQGMQSWPELRDAIRALDMRDTAAYLQAHGVRVKSRPSWMASMRWPSGSMRPRRA